MLMVKYNNFLYAKLKRYTINSFCLKVALVIYHMCMYSSQLSLQRER